MSGRLARLAAVIPFETIPAPPPVPPGDPVLQELVHRLCAAAALDDVDAGTRIAHQLLDHPWAGPVLAGAVVERAGALIAASASG